MTKPRGECTECGEKYYEYNLSKKVQYCPFCGAEIHSVKEEHPCPECGEEFELENLLVHRFKDHDLSVVDQLQNVPETL